MASITSTSAVPRQPRLSRARVGRVLGGWPIWLHRMGAGRLVGCRYAVISSIGRRTGRVRRAAVMVLRDDRATGEVFVVAGTRDAHWFRNVCEQPATEVWLADLRFRPRQRLLDAREVGELLTSIRTEHPREARVQAAFFGWPWPAAPETILEIAAGLGGVVFRPELNERKG